MSAGVSAQFTFERLENEFDCTSHDLFTFLYLGLFQIGEDFDDSAVVGEDNSATFSTWFKEHSSHTALDDRSCFSGKIELDGEATKFDNGGFFFGGFLYILKPINNQFVYHSNTGHYSNAGVHSGVYILINSFEDYNSRTLTESYKDYSIFKNSLNLIPESYIYEEIRAEGKTVTSTQSSSITLNPGVYFMSGSLTTITQRSGGHTTSAYIKPVRFGTETRYDDDRHLLHKYDEGYAITYRPLSESDINSNFHDSVEEYESLCVGAIGKVHIYTADGGVCCGNDEDDEGKVYVGLDGNEKRCLKINNNWFLKSDSNQCSDDGGVFQSEALIGGAYNALDGSDGCCGDDPGYNSCVPLDLFCGEGDATVHCVWWGCEKVSGTCGPSNQKINPASCSVEYGCPSKMCILLDNADFGYLLDNADFGYIDSDSQFMCNNDLKNGNIVDVSLVTETENKWWDASDDPYMTHSIQETDYISNGDEWFVCEPNDELNDGDNFIATGEPLPQPAKLNVDMNTCIGVLNYLESIGNFDEITGHKIFTEDESHKAFTCDPNVNDAETFFDTLSAGSCIKGCFLGEGESIYEYYEYDPQTIICDSAPIPGCPGVELSDGNDGNDGGDGDGVVLTDPCLSNLENCLSGSVIETKNCEDMTYDDQKGELCSENKPYCTTNKYFLSTDHDPENNLFCCQKPITEKGSVCTELPEPDSRLNCLNVGGQWMDETSDLVCRSFYSGTENCCLHMDWELPNSNFLDNQDFSNKFLCSKWGDSNRFVECCGDSMTCFGSKDSALHSYIEPNGMYVTSGGSNFLVENFDTLYDGHFQTRFLKSSSIKNKNPLSVSIPFTNRNRRDWTGFEFLEFDVIFNVEFFVPENYFDFELVYSDLLGEEHNYIVQLQNFLVDGKTKEEIHHVQIPLPSNVVEAKKFFISTKNLNVITLIVDNIYVTGGNDNSETYYCAGNYGSWVNNLDGDDDNGFDSDAKLKDYAPYKEACNSIISFGWTGRLCCGDDTTTNNKENYVDEYAGCFQGNIVKDDEVVSEALSNVEYVDLLYFDKIFHQCSNEKTAKKYNSYENENNNYETDFVVVHDQKDQVGTHECVVDVNGQYIWLLSPELLCEFSGIHDYLNDSDFNPLVFDNNGYNLDSLTRCCKRNDVDSANDDEIDGDSGYKNGDQECMWFAGNETDSEKYYWASDLAGPAGYCEKELGGSSLSNPEKYGMMEKNSCCLAETVGTKVRGKDDEILFICLQDKVPGVLATSATIPGSEKSFQWWDAQTNTHQVHMSDLGEILSIGNEWLTCGEVEGVSLFNHPETESNPTCLQTIKAAQDVAGAFDFVKDNFDTFGVCGETKEYCCESKDQTYERNNFLTLQSEITPRICELNCYVREGETLYDYRTIPEVGKQFDEPFCKSFPGDQYCKEFVNSDVKEINSDFNSDNPTWNIPCSNIIEDRTGDSSLGHLCPTTSNNNKPICVTGDYEVSLETWKYGDNVGYCCIGEGDNVCRSVPTETEITQNSCNADYNGLWFGNDELTANDVCSSGLSSGKCCFMPGDEGWIKSFSQEKLQEYINPSISEGFICHPRGNQKWFGECCSGPDCEGLNSYSLFNNIESSEENPINGLFSLGDSYGTIENFNIFSRTGIEFNSKSGIIYSSTSKTPFKIIFEKNNRVVGNFNPAAQINRYLSFDIVYNADYINKIIFYDNNNGRAIFSFKENEITSYSSLNWNKIFLNLSEPESKSLNFDWGAVKEMELTSLIDKGISVQIDNIQFKDDNDLQYCTGQFGNWITDLDGLTNSITEKSLTSETDILVETIKFQDTCIASSHTNGWTGTMCCGDDTDGLSLAEYYTDTTAGCFNGSKILNGEIVGEKLSQDYNKQYLFYDDEFYKCNSGDSNSRQLLNFAILGIEDNINNLVTKENKKSSFGTVGTFMCDISGSWIRLGDISKTKLLASKMFDLVKNESSYSIHCDDITKVSPEKLEDTITEFNQDSVETFCTAQIYEQQPSFKKGFRTMVGFSIAQNDNTVTVEDFLASYASYLVFINLLENSDVDSFSQACMGEFPDTENEFFVDCKPQGYKNRTRILFNREYKIILISYVEEVDSDFQGLFKSKSPNLKEYTQVMLHKFMNFFTGWYTESIEEVVDRRLPTILSETNLDLQTIVIQGNQMLNKDYKEIAGYIESTENDEKSILVVEFTNFESSIWPLANRYYGAASEFNYMKGENKQLIQINVDLANERSYSFEPLFDWRLFTTALRIDTTFDGPFVGSEYNDGVLDIGELCDRGERPLLDEYNMPVMNDGEFVMETFFIFKHGTDSCGLWDFDAYGIINYDNKVICDSEGEIDYSGCNYCGDNRKLNSEDCDDGNNVDGDGCSSTCTAEVCGDGIISLPNYNGVYEVCDDSNNKLNPDDYNSETCDVYTHCNDDCTLFLRCIGDGDCDNTETCQNNPLNPPHVDCGYCDDDDDEFNVSEGDCDDNNDKIHPGADEICTPSNFADNNCNGKNDSEEGLTVMGYDDVDGDGYGDKYSSEIELCPSEINSEPNKPLGSLGYSPNNYDCDDDNDAIYPGAEENCDDLDNDCDSLIDENLKATYYLDNDGDGFGDISESILSCSEPSDYVKDNTDCDDSVYDEDNDCSIRSINCISKYDSCSSVPDNSCGTYGCGSSSKFTGCSGDTVLCELRPWQFCENGCEWTWMGGDSYSCLGDDPIYCADLKNGDSCANSGCTVGQSFSCSGPLSINCEPSGDSCPTGCIQI